VTVESFRVKYRLRVPYKYDTLEPLVFLTDICPEEDIVHPYFTIGKDGVVTVPAGYAWDGPSGPAIDSKCFMRGSLAHDIFYQASQLRLPLPPDWKAKADNLLIRLCREDGMSRLRAAWVHWAVKHFGKGDPKDLNQYDEVRIAP
jgi:hypothetical protein